MNIPPILTGNHPEWTFPTEPSPATRGDEHVYLSTSCFHEDHDYCASMTGQQGVKRPATCKFCGAHCVCLCHKASQTGGEPS